MGLRAYGKDCYEAEIVDKATVSFLSPLFSPDLLNPSWNARIRTAEILKSPSKWPVSPLFTHKLNNIFLITKFCCFKLEVA